MSSDLNDTCPTDCNKRPKPPMRVTKISMKLLSSPNSTQTQFRRAAFLIKRRTNWDHRYGHPQLQTATPLMFGDSRTIIRPLSTGMANTTTAPETTGTQLHIIGLGNVSKLIAHSLMTSQSPPTITMVFRSKDRLHDFTKAGLSITLYRRENGETTAEGFHGVSTDSLKANHKRIQTLIVGTKAYDALAAIRDVVFRLDSDSEVIFIQNGMGKRKTVEGFSRYKLIRVKESTRRYESIYSTTERLSTEYRNSTK